MQSSQIMSFDFGIMNNPLAWRCFPKYISTLLWVCVTTRIQSEVIVLDLKLLELSAAQEHDVPLEVVEADFAGR